MSNMGQIWNLQYTPMGQVMQHVVLGLNKDQAAIMYQPEDEQFRYNFIRTFGRFQGTWGPFK